MALEQIILDPKQLVKRTDNLRLGSHVQLVRSHHGLQHNVLHVRQQQAHVHDLDAQLRSLLTVLEARLARVHHADFVEVLPDLGAVGPVATANELDEVGLEEVLAVQDVGVCEGEFLDAGARRVGLGLLRLAGDKGLCGHVEGDQVGVDVVEDGREGGGDEGFGGLDGAAVVVGELGEGFEVVDAGGEVLCDDGLVDVGDGAVSHFQLLDRDALGSKKS